jgi:hypothetical protein
VVPRCGMEAARPADLEMSLLVTAGPGRLRRMTTIGTMKAEIQIGLAFPDPLLVKKPVEVPSWRHSDPPTSRLAAEEITRSGRRAIQRQAVLALVQKYPGCTSLELARHSGMDRYTLARRLPELEHEGAVKKCGQKVCSVGQRPAVTWVIA